MRIAVLAAALLGALPSAALAQTAPDPVPIEEWPLEKISAMGEAIYDHDRAAWVATDALLAHLDGDPATVGIAGWIVVEDGETLRVRFLRNDGGDLTSAFDVPVRDGRAGAVEVPADPTLSAIEQASFRARQTAINNVGRLRCSQNMNTVVLDDPDSDGWLVWLLTPMPDNGAIPMGGHYRFQISADGGEVLRRDQLSNTCFFAERPPRDARDAMLFYTQIVSKTPVETHVFLSIQNQLTLVITADGRYFTVGGRRIADITEMVNQK